MKLVKGCGKNVGVGDDVNKKDCLLLSKIFVLIHQLNDDKRKDIMVDVCRHSMVASSEFSEKRRKLSLVKI